MKLTITTALLQEMLSKAVKGASNDNQRPLTSMIAIQLKDNVLTLITSSESNYLYVSQGSVVGDDFYVVVPIDIFSKLISKITSENISMELIDDNLVVTGGGKYTIAVSLDADGSLVKYPDPQSTMDVSDFTRLHIKKSTLNLISQVSSASIASGESAKDLPEIFRGYYLADSIVTTDSIKMCNIGIDVCDGNAPILIRPETMELTDLFTSENLVILIGGNSDIVIHSLDTYDCAIVSKLYDDIDSYPIKELSALIDTEADSSCALNKADMLHALDRLSLFIDKFDEFGVYLTFTNEGLKMSNNKSSGEELVTYHSSNNFKPFAVKIDIHTLISQIKAAPGDLINMQYGNDTCVKFVDGNVTQLVAILEVTA